MKGFPWEFGIIARDQKIRIMGLPDQEKSLTVSYAVWIQYYNVTDTAASTHCKWIKILNVFECF